ncbi:MAG: alpha/beta hydrolase [Rubrivivax sp.]|nr:alpha/beta hydrolase [Rubrivivax sp.]
MRNPPALAPAALATAAPVPWPGTSGWSVPPATPARPWSACGEAAIAPAAGGARAPLVVALHASASSARQWRALATALEPAHRVLAVDLHDHGVGPAWTLGARHALPLTLEDEAALVAPLLAEAGSMAQGGGAHVVGHSYGGAVALKVASLYPRHVRSLVLYEPVAFRLLLDDPASHAEADEGLAVTAAVQTLLERGDEAGAARHFVDYWSGHGTWQATPEPARAAIAMRMPVVLQHFGALFNERAQVAAVGRLAELAKAGLPVLVLSGGATVATTRRIARRLRELLPAATHETLAGLGHMAPLTHTDVVNARIAAFLESRASGRDSRRAPQAAPRAATCHAPNAVPSTAPHAAAAARHTEFPPPEPPRRDLLSID